jgi:acyl carrier protein
MTVHVLVAIERAGSLDASRPRPAPIAAPPARRALRLLAGALGLPPEGHAFPHPRLSLSHTCRQGVAAAAVGVAAGIGVDLEHLRPADPRTARFFLRPHEEAWLRDVASPRDVAHVRLWTVKEALFKADLGNATRMLRDYAIDDPAAATGLARGPDGTRFTYTSIRRHDTMLTVAAAVHTGLSGDAMPTSTVTFDAVAARLGTLLAVPANRLTPKTCLADLAADSFELVELVIDLQEEFGVTFTQADLRPILTLGDLVALLRVHADAASN